MPLCKRGSFAKTTSAATVSQSITGVGFQPKCIMLLCTLQTADGNGAPHGMSMGFSVGTATTDMVCTSMWSADNVNPTNTNRGSNQSALCIVDNDTGSIANRVADCVLQSFDADGFTLSWTINNATAYTIHYMAWGGNDFQAKIVNVANVAGTGNRALTGAGFVPKMTFFMASGHQSWPSQAVGANFGLGCGISSAKRWAFAYNCIDAVSMATTTAAYKYQRTDSCALILNSTSSAEIFRADFVSNDSDGCTINVISNAAGSSGSLFMCYMGGGGNFDCGNFNKRTTTGIDTITTAFNNPSGIMVNSYNGVAGTTIIDDATHSIGMADATSDSCLGNYQQNKTLPTVAKQWVIGTKGARKVVGTTTDAEADVTLTRTGAELNWTTNDAVADQWLWAAWGNASPPPFQQKRRQVRRRRYI